MQEDNPDNDYNFSVSESTGLNLFAGFFLFALFLLILVNIIRSYSSGQIGIYIKLTLLTLPPAIIFIIKALLKKTIITVNKNGIYHYQKIVTSWENFIQAYITQDMIAGSISDDFVLMIEYCKNGEDGCFVRKIPLISTLNKSGEEVIAAIRYFTKSSLRS